MNALRRPKIPGSTIYNISIYKFLNFHQFFDKKVSWDISEEPRWMPAFHWVTLKELKESRIFIMSSKFALWFWKETLLKAVPFTDILIKIVQNKVPVSASFHKSCRNEGSTKKCFPIMVPGLLMGLAFILWNLNLAVYHARALWEHHLCSGPLVIQIKFSEAAHFYKHYDKT